MRLRGRVWPEEELVEEKKEKKMKEVLWFYWTGMPPTLNALQPKPA